MFLSELGPSPGNYGVSPYWSLHLIQFFSLGATLSHIALTSVSSRERTVTKAPVARKKSKNICGPVSGPSRATSYRIVFALTCVAGVQREGRGKLHLSTKCEESEKSAESETRSLESGRYPKIALRTRI